MSEVALMAMMRMIAAFEYYHECLVKRIRPSPTRHQNDVAELDCQFDRLCSVSGLAVLALVWKESDYVTDEDLEAAGFERLRKDKKITQHSLGAALRASAARCALCGSDDKYERRAQRIVEAAITFGLIEPQVGRRNLKPLRATKKLHELMIDVGGAIDTLFGA
jgi:hypothetical protein